MNTYFGLPEDHADISSLIPPLTLANSRYYFIGANPAPGFANLPNLPAEVTNNPDNNGNYNTMFIHSRAGLGSVTYFRSTDSQATPIYLFNCKPIDYPVGGDERRPQTYEEYLRYQDTVVAIRKNVGSSTNYVFGVPLYHLNADSVRQLFSQIMQ